MERKLAAFLCRCPRLPVTLCLLLIASLWLLDHPPILSCASPEESDEAEVYAHHPHVTFTAPDEFVVDESKDIDIGSKLDSRKVWNMLRKLEKQLRPDIVVESNRFWPKEQRLICDVVQRENIHIDSRSQADVVGRRTAVLVIAYNRPEYLEKTLESVAMTHPALHWPNLEQVSKDSFHVYISQDYQKPAEQSEKVSRIVQEFQDEYGDQIEITHWVHDQHFPTTNILTSGLRNVKSYSMISRHYFYALWRLFALREVPAKRCSRGNDRDEIQRFREDLWRFFQYSRREPYFEHFDPPMCPLDDLLELEWVSVPSIAELQSTCSPSVLEMPYAYDRVVILEDDMQISTDFFEYFEAFSGPLERDPSLYTISAWNDNGIAELAYSPTTIHRTDFFPGLGWMLHRKLWTELSAKWPLLYWDDWMRHPDQTKGRHSIRPEKSRTANFGELGVSKGMYYKKHVSQVQLNTEYIPFASSNLVQSMAVLALDKYRQEFFSRLANGTRFRFASQTKRCRNGAPFRYKANRRTVTVSYSNSVLGNIIVRFNPQHIDMLNRQLGLIVDDRNGIYRCSFDGVIVFGYNDDGYWGFAVPDGYETRQKNEHIKVGARDCCPMQ